MDCIITSGWLQKWSSRVLSDDERQALDRSCSGTYHNSSLPSTERVGSLKTRWFILQNDFLNYYDKEPKNIQDFSSLKGQIYLKGCKLKHGGLITPIYQHWSIGVPNTATNKAWRTIPQHITHSLAISLVTPNGVEYTFTSLLVPGEESIKDMENWAYSISYSIHLADKVKEEPMSGWLYKRGEKGHQFRNTKRRWCILQGSKLRYFSSPPKNNKIITLKGIIDLSHLSEISDKMLTQVRGRAVTVVGEEGSSWNGVECFGGNNDPSISSDSSAATSTTTTTSTTIGKETYEIQTVIGLSLSMYNEREFVLLFDSQDDRSKWVSAITAAVERSYSNTNLTIDAYKLVNQGEKQVLVSGWMRKTKANKWWERRFFTLTPTNLIYYKEDPPLKPLGSIFLLVSSCRIIKQKSLDSLDWCFSIADSRGIEYFFNTETQDQMDRWIKAIKQARKKMVLNLLEQGGKLIIPINIGKDCGLITVQVRDIVRINSLSNKIAMEISIPHTKTVTVVGENKLEIIYTPVDGESSEKKVEVTSQNPHGILQLFKDLYSCQT
eukprot:gene5358-6684_t